MSSISPATPSRRRSSSIATLVVMVLALTTLVATPAQAQRGGRPPVFEPVVPRRIEPYHGGEGRSPYESGSPNDREGVPGLRPIPSYPRKDPSDNLWNLLIIAGVVLYGLLKVLGWVMEPFAPVFRDLARIAKECLSDKSVRRWLLKWTLVAVLAGVGMGLLRSHLTQVPFHSRVGDFIRVIWLMGFSWLGVDLVGTALRSFIDAHAPQSDGGGIQHSHAHQLAAAERRKRRAAAEALPSPGTGFPLKKVLLGLALMVVALASFTGITSPDKDALAAVAKTAEELVQRADEELQRGDLNAAIATCSRVIELTPHNVDAHVSRGVAKALNGDSEGALADYNKTLVLDPKNVITYVNRGIANKEKGDYKAAIADYNKAVELDPKNGSAYFNRAIAKDDMGDSDGAIADYTTFIELQPQDSSAYQSRGLAKHHKQDYKAAIADYNKAVELDPKNGSAYFNSSLCYYHMGDLEHALTDCMSAISVDNTNAYHHFLAWALRIKRGEAAGASTEIKAFHEAHSATPKAEAWPLKISAFLAGKTREDEFLAAVASGNKETDLDHHCEAWFYSGMMRLRTGNKAEAAEAFRKCVETSRTAFTEYMMASKELAELR